MGGGSPALSLRADLPAESNRGEAAVKVLVLDEDTGPATWWGPAFAGAAVALAVGGAAASTIDSGGWELGPCCGGAAAALAVGGAAASTVVNSGEAEVSAPRRVTGGWRGHALEALAGEGGVGRKLVNLAAGPVIFGDRVTTGSASAKRECPLDSTRIVGTGVSVARGDTGSLSKRVRGLDSDSGYGHGVTDGERAPGCMRRWRCRAPRRIA